MLLGTEIQPSWGFDLHDIYVDQQAVDSEMLIAPFTMTEAKAAVTAMN
jgi:hypothetical protein